jgi:integrase
MVFVHRKENEAPNNILPIYKYEFFTDVMWIDWYGENQKKKFCLISVRRTNLETDATVKLIHPVSEYLLIRYSSASPNTMKKVADNLVVFFNYLHNHCKELNLTSLTELKVSDGVKFLNHISHNKNSKGKDLVRGTVVGYNRCLTNFYKWLSDQGFLPEIPASRFVLVEGPWGKYFKSPFTGVQYPSSSQKKIEHAFPLQYFPLLLEISVIIAPRITLGIYIQFMGGLRHGEVTNLSRSHFQRRIKNGDFIFDVKDHHHRTDIKDHTSTEVKKPRTQEVFNIKDWLPKLFEDHKVRFKPKDGGDALFVNRDGKAMTAKSYSQYFNNVKDRFCDYLKAYGDEEDVALAGHLRYVNWSTHIGRGTFTNMIAERTDNPFLIAYKRGDSTPESSLPYIQKTARIRKKIEAAFSNLNNKYMPSLVERRKKGDGSKN